MQLTAHQQEMLDGKHGETMAKVMKTLVMYGETFGAKDMDNLLLAGRCISGDFYPHGAYRMMGNTSAMGEAAGFGAAYVCRKDIALNEIPADALRQRMQEYL